MKVTSKTSLFPTRKSLISNVLRFQWVIQLPITRSLVFENKFCIFSDGSFVDNLQPLF